MNRLRPSSAFPSRFESGNDQQPTYVSNRATYKATIRHNLRFVEGTAVVESLDVAKPSRTVEIGFSADIIERWQPISIPCQVQRIEGSAVQ